MKTVGTTRYVDFHTVKETYKTRADKCHVSHVVGDSGWEFKLANELEEMGDVVALRQEPGAHLHDPLHDQRGRAPVLPRLPYPASMMAAAATNLLNLVVEVTGERKKDKVEKTATARHALGSRRQQSRRLRGAGRSWRSPIRMMT